MPELKTLAMSDSFILYTTPSGQIKVEVLFQDENIWMTQEKIALLFGVDRTVVTKHLKNIYKEGELEQDRTSAKFAQVQIEGERQVTRDLIYYNLDVIISVGYRVNSSKATQFRIWATERLKEYIIKGFSMAEFAESVNKFLSFNEYKILEGKGKISKEKADNKAIEEYRKFNRYQKIENDFEKHLVQKLKTKFDKL